MVVPAMGGWGRKRHVGVGPWKHPDSCPGCWAVFTGYISLCVLFTLCAYDTRPFVTFNEVKEI